MLSLIVLVNVVLNRTVVVDSDRRYCLVNYVAMLLVVCQLSRDVIGYEDSQSVIGAFRSVYRHS